MQIKIYLGCNEGLPQSERSLKIITDRIAASTLSKTSPYIVRAPADKFEYPALDACWSASQDEDFYGLYLHCKGASKQNETEFLNCAAWLEYMLYGLVSNYEICIDHMERGADLVGCMWYRHFKGNCFWFKSTYARKLVRPMFLNTRDRYVAEYWCSEPHWVKSNVRLPKVKNLFYMPLLADTDFLKLQQEQYLPALNSKVNCSNFAEIVSVGRDLSVYDNITLTAEEYEAYKHLLPKYTNYDATVTVTNI